MTTGSPVVGEVVETLRRGGTAMDAALVASLAQTVLSAGSWDSFAGILSLLYWDARTGTVHFLDAGYNTVRAETQPLSIPSAGTPSGRATLVPGYMAGVAAAHERFGRLPFPDLFVPAIRLAEGGFRVEPFLHQLMVFRRDVLARTSEGRAVFEDGTGELLQPGEILRQPRLARTLRRVAAEGPSYMYTGEWGQRLVAAVRNVGGAMTREDLARYEPIWSEPLRTTYGNDIVYTSGPPSLGGVCTVEALHLLEKSDMRRLGHYSTTSESLYWLIQITQSCHLGYFAFAPSAEARSRKETAATLWHRMQTGKGLSLLDRLEAAPGSGHTDAVVVVDGEGNIAVLGHSSNTISWGTTGLFVEGVSVPDSGSFQQRLIASTGPGARLPNALSPTIIVGGGKPVLAAVATGDSVHEVMLQNLVNILDFDMDLHSSLAAPTFLRPVWPASAPVNLVLFGIGALVFLWAAVIWLGIEGYRAVRQRSLALPSGIRLLAGLTALIELGFLAGLGIALSGGTPTVLRGFHRPGLTTVLAILLLALSLLAWRRRYGSVGGRLALTLFALAALVFMPFVDSSTRFHTVIEEGTFAEAVLEGVEALGQPLIRVKEYPPKGYWAGVRWNRAAGGFEGGVSPASWDAVAVGH